MMRHNGSDIENWEDQPWRNHDRCSRMSFYIATSLMAIGVLRLMIHYIPI